MGSHIAPGYLVASQAAQRNAGLSGVINPELCRPQFLVRCQQQGEIVGMGGIRIKVQRTGSARITAVNIAAQHAKGCSA